MENPKIGTLFRHLDVLELSLCLFFNRASHRHGIEHFFAVISRLGDGVFWYVLMLAFALLDYPDGLKAALHMGIVSLSGLFIYKQTKDRMSRQRPAITWEQISNALALEKPGYGDVMHQHDTPVLMRWLAKPNPDPRPYPNVAGEIVKWFEGGMKQNQSTLARKLWAQYMQQFAGYSDDAAELA